jgi:hypothetical protein
MGRGGGAGLNARDGAWVLLVLTTPLTRSLACKVASSIQDKIGTRDGYNVLRKPRLKTSLLISGCRAVNMMRRAE